VVGFWGLGAEDALPADAQAASSADAAVATLAEAIAEVERRMGANPALLSATAGGETLSPDRGMQAQAG
jgi:hypothetical protein